MPNSDKQAVKDYYYYNILILQEEFKLWPANDLLLLLLL